MSFTAKPETGEIVDTLSDGRGVVRTDGKTVFVHGALKGEIVKFVRRKKRRNFDEGELLEVLLPMSGRVEPRCEYFGSCGGCSLQHISAEEQLRLKQSVLLDSLQRIGSVQPGRLLDPIVGDAWGYRRKARLAVKHVQKKCRVLVGFRERNKPYVADMLSCETLHPAIGGLIGALSEFIGELSIRDRIPQIETAVGDNGIAMIFRVLTAPDATDFKRFGDFQLRHGVQLYLQTGGPESVHSLPGLAKPKELFYEIPDANVTIQFRPTDFLQAHAQVNQKMIKQAVDLLEPGSETRVLDLFCGLGNFTLPIATVSKNVTGVDFAEDMIARARLNASISGIDNANFETGDLSRPLELSHVDWKAYEIAILDPPRTGALELMRMFDRFRARRVLYTSCHPGSLARDARILVHEHGYQLVAAGILDMFPQTSHIESMALFERRVKL
jgi:23S rRNA (uracil1939-C5)-methyltransferase